MSGRHHAFIRDAALRLKPHLERARTAALCTHVNPDGDGIGAEICLLRYLGTVPIEARIINTETLAPRYRFLDSAGAVEVFDAARHEPFLREADLIFMLDNASVSRLGPLEAATRASRATTICIDHHNVVDPFWKISIVDEQASATGELVYRLIREMGGTVDPVAAVAAYVSLVTDTGYFRFSKTSSRSHEAAAELLSLGVDPPRVYEEVFERNSLAQTRLAGIALYTLRQEEGGRLAWFTLTHRQVLECGAEREDTSDVVNGLLAVDGVRLAVMLREMGDGRIKLSFRSKGALDVNGVAAVFGGGGHTNAAGAVVEGTLGGLREPVLASCRELLRRGDGTDSR